MTAVALVVSCCRRRCWSVSIAAGKKPEEGKGSPKNSLAPTVVGISPAAVTCSPSPSPEPPSGDGADNISEDQEMKAGWDVVETTREIVEREREHGRGEERTARLERGRRGL